MKECTKCGEVKPLSSYSLRCAATGQLQYHCKECVSAYKRLNRARFRKYHQDYIAGLPDGRREYYKQRSRTDSRSSKYGLQETVGLELRQMPCMICGVLPGEAPGRHGQLHIDHCHETKAVRGALCHKCNTSLGIIEAYLKDPDKINWYLSRGADYRSVDTD